MKVSLGVSIFWEPLDNRVDPLDTSIKCLGHEYHGSSTFPGISLPSAYARCAFLFFCVEAEEAAEKSIQQKNHYRGSSIKSVSCYKSPKSGQIISIRNFCLLQSSSRNVSKRFTHKLCQARNYSKKILKKRTNYMF